MWISESASEYLPVLVMLLIGLTVGAALIGLNALIGARDKLHIKEKFDTYECGVPPVGNARQPFSVRYYVVGIMFLLFDVEVIFLYPWAITYKKFLSQGAFILIEMLTFMAILLVGYVYILRKKGLEWD